MNNDVTVISSRIRLLFDRASHTRYWILVADDPYDQTYNFFFERQRVGERLKSVPLHKLLKYELKYLEYVINELKKQIQLTIHFVGFVGQRWPANQRMIQRKRDELE